MNLFESMLEEETDALDEMYESVFLEFIENAYGDDVTALAEDLEIEEGEAVELVEELRKRVNSKGNVTKIRSKDYRSRHAAQTTGLSKSQLRLRARKSARTKKRNPTTMKRALKKRAKALRRRKQMGLH